ncbi:unnamed protein product [Brassica rapa subsp. trilocularis]
MTQGVPSGMDLIGLLRVMQLGMNSHKIGRIVSFYGKMLFERQYMDSLQIIVRISLKAIIPS